MDHVVENWCYSLFGEVGVREPDNGIEVLPKYGVFLLDVPEFLVFDDELGGRLAILAPADPEIVHEKVAAKTA